MGMLSWRLIQRIPSLVATVPPDPEHEAYRIRTMERNISLPVKMVVMGLLFYYLFLSRWGGSVYAFQDSAQEVVFEVIQRFFPFYALINVTSGIMLLGMNQLPLTFIRWVVFTTALIDSLLLAGMTLLTGGFDSILFWIYLGLIIRNAFSFPEAPVQITLNLLVSGAYIMAGLLDVAICEFDLPPGAEAEVVTESFVLRLVLLILMTLCCYAVQVLMSKQTKAEEEAREYALRQQQLRAAGQLAAEIAHQLKNPLGIINNAAFNLQRNVKDGKASITQQIGIIREEVERSDRIITDLMGYARLVDGKLEKLNPIEEMDRAIEQVFPAAVNFPVTIHRDYGHALPLLLMQRNHLSEILVNLLQNAREAISAQGNIYVSAKYGDNYTVVYTIADDGPGIPPEVREKVFEPYYTTKSKGTGLGLSIVKHNTELYDGSVKVSPESEKGAKFIVTLPAKSLMKLRT